MLKRRPKPAYEPGRFLSAVHLFGIRRRFTRRSWLDVEWNWTGFACHGSSRAWRWRSASPDIARRGAWPGTCFGPACRFELWPPQVYGSEVASVDRGNSQVTDAELTRLKRLMSLQFLNLDISLILAGYNATPGSSSQAEPIWQRRFKSSANNS